MVVALAAGECARASGFGLFVRSLEPAGTESEAAAGWKRPRDLRLSPQEGLGAAAGGGRNRLRPLDRLEGPPSLRPVAAAADRAGAGQSLRVALSGRSAAHGHEPLRALR